RRAAPRAHALACLPAFATFFAETLVPLDAWSGAFDDTVDEVNAGDTRADAGSLDAMSNTERRRERRGQMPAFDLRPLAARQDSAHSLLWAGVLRRAIDAGQDRAVIEAIAQRFAVADNVVR